MRKTDLPRMICALRTVVCVPAMSAWSCVALLLGSVASASAADWSDTSIGYRYGSDFREPANPNKVSKDIVNFTHVSGYKYGTNFLSIDLLKSDKNDPAAPTQAPSTGPGAQEAYLIYRHTLSLGKATGSPSFKFGPVRDVGVTAGFDLSAKNTAFASNVRRFLLGPTLSFDVPGFLDFSLFYHSERGHNGIPPLISTPLPPGMTEDVKFDDTYMLGLVWSFPIAAVNAKFTGHINYIGKKGRDGFGTETEPETLSHAYLLFDVGALAGRKETLYVGPGVEYWRNKFGDPGPVGSDYTAWQIAVELHF